MSPPRDAVALFGSLFCQRRKADSLVGLSHAGFTSWFHYVLAMWPGANDLTSLSLGFSILKMGIMTITAHV